MLAIETWLDALTRAVPAEAQAIAELAQGHIDEAGESAGGVSARVGEYSAVLDPADDQQLSLIAMEATKLWRAGWTPPVNLPHADGDEQAMNIWLSTAAAVAELAFDTDVFWEVVQRTAIELSESKDFARLVEDDLWRSDYLRHAAGLAESQAIVEAAVAARLRKPDRFGERALVRAELQRYTCQVEGLVKFVLRTRLAVARSESYESQPTTLGPLLDRCLNHRWYVEVDGIDRQLRNATSHEDVDVDTESGDVVLDPGKASERRLAPILQ